MPQPTGREFWESYLADQFFVQIGGVDCPGVTKITGLSLFEYETIEQPQGGTHHVYKIASQKVKFQPLVIERRVDDSDEDKFFMRWFNDTFRLKEDQSRGSTVRKSGLITKRHNGEDKFKFVFLHAWVKSATFTDLEAGSNSLFLQTITLEHEGLELVPPG